ncbi:MAG: DUF4783 domain-containing protein [Bacteroidales bacterium]|nr:DUF4783 domain-containing protein [Bacteroidales bacterium]
MHTNKGFIKIVILIFISTFLLNINIQGQSIAEVKTQCINSLKENKIDNFISTFSNPVDISLPESENSYSKIQAKQVMKSFLKKNPTKSFKVEQSGKSTGGSEFVIAILETKHNKKYQIYLLITNSDNIAKLHLVEFELIK